MALVMWFVVLGTCVWVYFDSRELGMRKGGLGGGGLDMSTRSWVICCAIIWLIAFPAYLIARGRYRALATTGPTGPVQSWPAQSWPVQSGPVQSWPTAAFVPAQSSAPYTAPPQLSADGHWWWNGGQWVPTGGTGSATGPSVG